MTISPPLVLLDLHKNWEKIEISVIDLPGLFGFSYLRGLCLLADSNAHSAFLLILGAHVQLSLAISRGRDITSSAC